MIIIYLHCWNLFFPTPQSIQVLCRFQVTRYYNFACSAQFKWYKFTAWEISGQPFPGVCFFS